MAKTIQEKIELINHLMVLSKSNVIDSEDKLYIDVGEFQWEIRNFRYEKDQIGVQRVVAFVDIGKGSFYKVIISYSCFKSYCEKVTQVIKNALLES